MDDAQTDADGVEARAGVAGAEAGAAGAEAGAAGAEAGAAGAEAGAAGAEPGISAAAAGIAGGTLHALDPRSIALGRTVGWITTGVLSLGLLVGLAVVLLAADGLSPLARAALVVLWAALSGALAWFAHRWPAIEHRHAAWRLDSEVIEIRRGVVWRAVITVPKSRVQHTDVSQGPLQRRYGLGTLSIHTAGTDHAQVQLGGLDHATALAIRDHLLPGQLADAV